MQQGRIVRAAGGFFSLSAEDGLEYTCRARGNLKRGKGGLMVGDLVLFEALPSKNDSSDREGVIERLLPRKNSLTRPAVANIDQLIVVMAFKEPECDWQLVSRLFVYAEKEDLEGLLCLNKIDLAASPGENPDYYSERIDKFPYPCLFTSAKTGMGIESLAEALQGKFSVFAGPSGVGKSSLLNALQPGLSLQTGSVSDKIKRGRHTTRQAELLSLHQGGAVVDTPGFSRLDFMKLDPEELPHFFPEFEPLLGQCAFRNCRHSNEPDCAVIKEVGSSINPLRYEHYLYFLEELKQGEVY